MVKRNKVGKIAATLAASTLALGSLGLVTPVSAADSGYSKLGTGLDVRSTLFDSSAGIEIEKMAQGSCGEGRCGSNGDNHNGKGDKKGNGNTARYESGEDEPESGPPADDEDVSSYANGKGRHYRYNNSSGKSGVDRNTSHQRQVWR